MPLLLLLVFPLLLLLCPVILLALGIAICPIDATALLLLRSSRLYTRPQLQMTAACELE